MLESLGPWLGVPVLHSTGLDPTARLNPWYEQIGHCLFTLLAAVLGGILARLLFAAPADRSESDETGTRPTGTPPRTWWPEADDRRPGGPGAGRLGRHDPVQDGPGLLGRRDVPPRLRTARADRPGRDRRARVGGGRPDLGGDASSAPATCSWSSRAIRIRRSRPARSSTSSARGSRRSPMVPGPRTRVSSKPWNGRSPCISPTRPRSTTLLEYIKQATATPTDHGIPIYVDLIRLIECERDTVLDGDDRCRRPPAEDDPAPLLEAARPRLQRPGRLRIDHERGSGRIGPRGSRS